MNAPISVIIPAYNAERFIERALRSVQAQTLPVAEIIVVDDGSSDGTTARATALGATVFRQKNAGVASARNTGVAMATAPYIAFLDADDAWHEDKIAQCWSAIQATKADFLFHDYLIICPTAAPRLFPSQAIFHQRDGLNKPWAALYAGNCIGTSTVIMRRKIFPAAGFDPGLQQAEDYSLWLTVFKQRPVIATLDKALTFYHRQPTGLSRQYRRMLVSSLKVGYQHKPSLTAFGVFALKALKNFFWR